MSRYIDADKLNIKKATMWFDDPNDRRSVERMIREAPTVDAVPVVRCCDCNNRNDEEKCPMCHTEEVTFDDGDGYIEYESWIKDKTDDNGFCHKWERRTDDE